MPVYQQWVPQYEQARPGMTQTSDPLAAQVGQRTPVIYGLLELSLSFSNVLSLHTGTVVTPRVTHDTVVFWLARALTDSNIAPFDEVDWLTILENVVGWIGVQSSQV